MSVFADTSGLYALMVRTEEDHEAMVRAFRSLLSEPRPLVTTSYVLIETEALLQHRIGIAAVRDFEEEVVPLLSIDWVADGLHRKGVVRLLRENRRNLSLVDCVSLERIEELEIRDVLGRDPHFEKAGCRLLPVKKMAR